ncbi:sugar transferase [Liquorilactobacillus hordei]|uniref:Priming glycosyl transferase n=1 Tax=Liquorilactobacillus hordei DSM 19519 TaxID=1423759 RepID=A0A0R1MP03_9LACO|nr:sugar transferase [Liquorilactobacillus hordei]KRL07492.1 priming glycosyl transferase [Liquorilactobacillus hordei DSM 19519]QYH52196.1 sugar transferase [Liquorilactobacillus hordei DSM 19519]
MVIDDLQDINFDHNQIINLKKLKRRRLYRFCKRITDVTLSACGLVALSPVLLMVAGAIKHEETDGTIIYKQQRVGKNGKLFSIYKFRSMCMGADKKLEELKQLNEVDGAMFKLHNDPRVTKIGKLLRRTSLDELPQLYNVLKGDMSLVGPRPPLPDEVKEYTEYDKQRLLVIPGCTGLWQVSARNEVGFHEMVELDLQYIKKSGLLYDLAIILKTIKIMIVPNGAY